MTIQPVAIVGCTIGSIVYDFMGRMIRPRTKGLRAA